LAKASRVEDLEVYRLLCDLHIDICKLTSDWPRDERYELTSQVRRSSNSAPANLAEKQSDRHVKNKIEGVNRARGESLETIHHLYIAARLDYISADTYETLRERIMICVRMLNGLERAFEKHLPPDQRIFKDT
jgi:four helix bundle protein